MYILTYVRTYICTYVQTYILTYLSIYLHTYRQWYIHVYLSIYVYMCTYIHTYIYIYTKRNIYGYLCIIFINNRNKTNQEFGCLFWMLSTILWQSSPQSYFMSWSSPVVVARRPSSIVSQSFISSIRFHFSSSYIHNY